MLHLSSGSGLWVPCPVGDDGKCELRYHAPVEEGKVSYSLLMETYASEELCREPSWSSQSKDASIWTYTILELGTNVVKVHREYGLPALIEKDSNGDVLTWYSHGRLLGSYHTGKKLYDEIQGLPEGAKLYVNSFVQ